MYSENTSDDASNFDDFVNLRDIIPPKVKEQNIPAEYSISEYFLVPGVITQYFKEQVLFKPYLSDEIYNVPYNEIRYPPNEAIHCSYEAGNKVEVYMLDVKLNLHGWAKSTIKSSVKNTYVVKLEQRNALVIVQRDKLRATATDANLDNKYVYTFNIPVPKKLQNFASNIQVHDSLSKAIGNFPISYDFEKNELVINSNNFDSESIAKMLLEVHFENLSQRMLLSESIDALRVKFQKLKTEDLLEQFQVHPDLLKYIIGRKGINIQKAESIPGVTFIAVLNDISTIKIYARNEAALKEAYEVLRLDREIIQISSEMIKKIIGKNGQKVQEIANRSKLRHIVIITNENPASDVTELELIGTPSSIASAKCLLKYYLDYLQGFKKLVLASGQVDQQCNSEIGDKNTVSSTESPAEDVSSFRLTRRVVTGQNCEENGNFSANVNEKKLEPELNQFNDNQDLIFYNGKLSRGTGISFRGRANSVRRSRGRLNYQTTQSHRVDDSENKNVTNQTVQQFQQSTTNRSRSRGRGRGRGRRAALPQLLGVNSITSRESQNDSSTDENHEQIQNQLLLEAGDASTSRDEQELEGQQNPGQRVFENSQQRNTSNGTSDTNNQTAEIPPTLENQKSWLGKRWRKRAASSSDVPTWEYENLSKVYYGKSNTNNSTDATGDSAAREDDNEEET